MNSLEETDHIINLAVFPTTLILDTLFFLRFKCRTDNSVKLILLIDLCVMTARVFLESNGTDHLIDSVVPVGNMLS